MHFMPSDESNGSLIQYGCSLILYGCLTVSVTGSYNCCHSTTIVHQTRIKYIHCVKMLNFFRMGRLEVEMWSRCSHFLYSPSTSLHPRSFTHSVDHSIIRNAKENKLIVNPFHDAHLFIHLDKDHHLGIARVKAIAERVAIDQTPS